MAHRVSDSPDRRTALDITRSFIVQAPAGSGKTELLIQRYLALLAAVDLPEQIVAITFTRKAAAEMRGRVLGALKRAAGGEIPDQPHERETHGLACRALARDREHGWALIDQPQRLRIDTLDALNAWLARQLPLLTGGVAGARIVEDARDLYALTARRLLEQIGNATPVAAALRHVLEFANSGVERLETLLAGLLPARDQWLPHLLGHDEARLRNSVESAMRRVIAAELIAVSKALPPYAATEVVPLLQHAAVHAPKESILDRLGPWRQLDRLPPPECGYLEAWQALPLLLLTQKGRWRKQLRDVGFPAGPDGLREKLAELIGSLSQEEALRCALEDLAALPAPQLSAAQWDTLAALRVVLHHLVGELRLLFGERNSIDFVELALAAQRALGAVDAPSELLLALDRRLQHILVDEFQDTSHTQLRFLELLTAGWERGDGRSLFLVGDPMQSIYRFRNADMSLFLKTKRQGVGDIRCEPLVLERNFRSGPPVINWINTTFPTIFPDTDDLKTGAARFSPCTGTRTASDGQAVEMHALRGTDPEAEVRRVAEILVAERAHSPTASVAILVQSRSHLAGLQEQLRPLGLPVHAVEIDAPNQHQVIHDLIGLTRALTHLGDRVAWLGVLRAPWCGLTWQDLHALCWDDRDSAIWSLINDSERIGRLTPNGRHRLERSRSVLDLAFRTRAGQRLAGWIERTWLSLQGPACLDFPEELDRAQRFFLTLDDLESWGDLDDPSQLESRFAEPKTGSDPPQETGIEIMTIHRAKGLEFDTVILLGLGREPPPEEAKGLYWVERVDVADTENVLLAPLTTNAPERDSLADWLRGIERRRDLSERARLLYVATTRAKDRLHLVGQLPPNKAPPSRSLLACLWSCVADAFDRAETDRGPDTAETRAIQPRLRRLAEPARAPAAPTEIDPKPDLRPEFEWAGQAAVQVGTVVHRGLQVLAEEGTGSWDAERVAAAAPRYRAELALLGVDNDELEWATKRVVAALQAVLADSRGLWVLANHEDARSEFAITMQNGSALEHVRLDRTFVADGVRWIIDFKTSAHEGGATEEFLDSEVDRYRGQLERYALAMTRTEDRPVRVGLYFPLLQAFRDWEPDLHE